MYKLTTDIYSTLRPTVKYGTAGEEIRIVADHDDVLIVEGASGRFPVAKGLLDEERCKTIEQINLL